jgi:hypothetical protein
MEACRSAPTSLTEMGTWMGVAVTFAIFMNGSVRADTKSHFRQIS